MLGIFKRNKADEDLSKLIEENREEPSSSPLTEEEKELLSASMQFNNSEAEDVAVPTQEVAYVDINDDFGSVINKFQETRFNKLLVINGNMDSVLGVVNIADVISFIDNRAEFDLKSILRDCTFVPESLNLPKVTAQLQINKHSVAVVVDEYGGTSGIITSKDILAEFVGEINEEDSQIEQKNKFIKLSEDMYHLDPRLEIDELLEFVPSFNYDLNGEDEDFETVSGLILQLAKKIPEIDEEIIVSDNWKFKILDVNPRKINKVELKNVIQYNEEAIK